MTHEVARMLASSLLPLYTRNLVTVLGGMVKTATQKRDEKTVKFPVPFSSESMPLRVGNEDFVPDYRQRAILYFEGENAVIESNEVNKTKLSSNLRLVCWFNAEKFETTDGSSVHVALFAEIMALLPKATRLPGKALGMKLKFSDVQESVPRIFSKYSYTEERGQFLLPPFYAFGIGINASYQINHCNDNGQLFPSDVSNVN